MAEDLGTLWPSIQLTDSVQLMAKANSSDHQSDEADGDAQSVVGGGGQGNQIPKSTRSLPLFDANCLGSQLPDRVLLPKISETPNFKQIEVNDKFLGADEVFSEPLIGRFDSGKVSQGGPLSYNGLGLGPLVSMEASKLIASKPKPLALASQSDIHAHDERILPSAQGKKRKVNLKVAAREARKGGLSEDLVSANVIQSAGRRPSDDQGTNFETSSKKQKRSKEGTKVSSSKLSAAAVGEESQRCRHQ